MFLVPILIDEKQEHVRVFLLLYLKLEVEILVMKIMLVSTTYENAINSSLFKVWITR